MNELEEQVVQCPYCGETLSVLIDCSVPDQQYIEDCQVCCQPINFYVVIADNGNIKVDVKTGNE